MDLKARTVKARGFRKGKSKYQEFIDLVAQWVEDELKPWVENQEGDEPALEIPVPIIEDENGEVVTQKWASRVGGYVINNRTWAVPIKAGYFKNEGDDKKEYPYIVYVVKDESD